MTSSLKAFFDWLGGRILWILYGACALAVVAEIVFRLTSHSYEHVHFGFEKIFGFHAGWGFLTFALLVASAHALGALTRRDESYYEDRSEPSEVDDA